MHPSGSPPHQAQTAERVTWPFAWAWTAEPRPFQPPASSCLTSLLWIICLTPSIVSDGSTPRAMVELAFTKICTRNDNDKQIVDTGRDKETEIAVSYTVQSWERRGRAKRDSETRFGARQWMRRGRPQKTSRRARMDAWTRGLSHTRNVIRAELVAPSLSRLATHSLAW